ncbi:MAG: ABC transporter ATP-binding protein [Sarcina sp.]
MANKLKIENLTYSISGNEILKGIDIEILNGKFVGILGANGSGKSTLLKTIYRVYKSNTGKIYIDGRNIEEITSKEIAKEIAVLAQENISNFDFSVKDMIQMGRYPYKNLFSDYSKEDENIVLNLINKLNLQDVKHRNFNSLSGGEKQRTLIARALAQKTDFIILDEPTNHLDIGYQIQLMDILKSLDITIFAAIHDMNIAAMYCDYLIVIKDGIVFKKGTVEEVLTEDLLKNVFNVNAHIGINPVTEKKQVFYMPN